MILEPSGTDILLRLKLPSVAVFVVASGLFDVEYRIVASCRDGNLYTVKNSGLTGTAPSVLDFHLEYFCLGGQPQGLFLIDQQFDAGTVIELESQPCGLAQTQKTIIVGCMNSVIHSYHIKGKKNIERKLEEF